MNIITWIVFLLILKNKKEIILDRYSLKYCMIVVSIVFLNLVATKDYSVHISGKKYLMTNYRTIMVVTVVWEISGVQNIDIVFPKDITVLSWFSPNIQHHQPCLDLACFMEKSHDNNEGFFINFKKNFDIVSRILNTTSYGNLQAIFVSSNLLVAVARLQHSVWAKINDSKTQEILRTIGVIQDLSQFPALFEDFIDDVKKWLEWCEIKCFKL